MELYPGMQAHIGRWSFYIVKMTMREVAEGVKFASDVYDNSTLDEALQRVLDESRVKRDIVSYLQRQRDRFFNSIVIAALGGEPKWYPVNIEDDPRFVVFRDDRRLNETFGILSFDGSQNYYALDGQHRLAAIKALVDPKNDAHRDAPPEFEKEEISVLIVVPDAAEDENEFRQRYRRLFGNLNRYAKPMDQVTNIIMDEDDVFAIITRRLISDHEFFTAAGSQYESHRVKTSKGKSLSKQEPYFTSLETLYQMNIALLNSRKRRNDGWGDDGEELRRFMRFRPSDEDIDGLYRELASYWDGLLDALPVLRDEPVLRRNHAVVDEPDSGEEQDLLVFWPIGQELLADIARDLLDMEVEDPNSPKKDEIAEALRPLGTVDWHLGRPPWKHLIVVPDSAGKGWRMRSEQRKEAVNVASRYLAWRLGLEPLDAEGVRVLRDAWESLLLAQPVLRADDVDELWRQATASMS